MSYRLSKNDDVFKVSNVSILSPEFAANALPLGRFSTLIRLLKHPLTDAK